MADRSSSPRDQLAARLGEQKLSPEDPTGAVRPPAPSGSDAPMARRDQHLVKPRGSDGDRATEMKRRQEEEKRELEQEEKTAAKQKAMIGQTRSRRSSKESIDADESGLTPVRSRRPSKMLDSQLDPWEEMFAGPGVPKNVVRSRRNSRDLSAKVMQLQYAKFTQQADEEARPATVTGSGLTGAMAAASGAGIGGALAKPSATPLTNPFGGGDMMGMVAKAAL